MNAPPNPTPGNLQMSARSSVMQLIETEPSLIDLLFMLARYKWLVITTCLLGTAIGFFLAITVPRSFSYSTTIHIGSIERESIYLSRQVGYADKDSTDLIESPDAIISNITTVYLPTIEREYGTTINQPGFVLGLEVKNPRNTNLIVMTSKGPLDDEAAHRAIQAKIADRILADHRKKFAFLHANLTQELEECRRQADALKDQAAALAVRQTLLQERRGLAKNRIEQNENDLARVINNRELAGKSLAGQDQLLTLMMLDLQLLRERDKSMELKRELAVDLTEAQDRITREEADLSRSRQDQMSRIAAIQARISHVDVSRVVGETQRSQKAVSFDPIVIVGLAAVLGTSFGIMLAACARAILARRASASLGKQFTS